MTQSPERVFSDQFLADAGVISVDLMARALNADDRLDALVQLERLNNEIMAMYYNYRGWQKNMLAVFAEREGEAKVEQVKAAIESDAAPERKISAYGVVDGWKNEISLINNAIDDGKYDLADQSARSLHSDALAFHDGMMSRVAAILSELYRSYGDQVVQQTLQKVMDPSAIDPDGKLPFKEKVEQLIFFTRVHLLPFNVTEDDEKATFMPDPCPSGARLIRGGHYEAPRNGAKVIEVGPLTYGQSDFPIYCCHEPAMEISSVLNTGVPVFIVDPSEQLGITPCKVYVYKRNEDIPASYFERLGLKKPQDLIAKS